MIVAGAALGMTEAEFWDTTPAYFFARHQAYAADKKDKWEQFRYVSYLIVKSFDDSNRIHRPSDLLQFDWDEKPKRFDEYTPEEMALVAQFDRDADEILKKTNPEAYAKYIAAKNGGS